MQSLFKLIDEDAGFANMSLIDLWEIGDVLLIEVEKRILNNFTQ
jgi:hypothetical protein